MSYVLARKTAVAYFPNFLITQKIGPPESREGREIEQKTTNQRRGKRVFFVCFFVYKENYATTRLGMLVRQRCIEIPFNLYCTLFVYLIGTIHINEHYSIKDTKYKQARL